MHGQCECFNVTLINMLGTLPEKPKSTWKEQVPYIGTCLQLYYKQCNWFQSSPYYLMFGWKPHLPVDLIFGTNTVDLKGNSITYVENLKKRMEWAYKLQMVLLRKNRKGTINVMTARSYARN